MADLGVFRRRQNRDLMVEVASRLRDPFEQLYMGVLRPNDPVLLEKGGGFDYRIYRDLRRDGKVFGALQKRELALVGRAWQVEPVESGSVGLDAAAQVTAILKALPFDQICRNLLDATLMGFSPNEIVWDVRDGAIVPDRIIKRAQRRFRFVQDEQSTPPVLHLLTQSEMLRGEPLPDRKFIVHRVNPEDDNPYGTGLGQVLYWPVFFKRLCLIGWNKMNDRFSAPTPWGRYPRSASPREKSTLFDALRAMQNDGCVMTPEGMSIELIEAKLTGSVSSQRELYEAMNDWIADVILGQEPRSGSGGAQAAAAKERRDVRLDLVQADSDLLSDTLNSTLIHWICEFNGLPPVLLYRVIKEEEDLKSKSETDRNVYGMGFRPTLERILANYGEGWEVDEARPTGAQQSVESASAARAVFSEPDDGNAAQRSIDDAVAQLDATALANASAALLEPLVQLIESCGSYEEALARLGEAYPKMDTTLLQAMLANAMFGAQAYGRLVD